MHAVDGHGLSEVIEEREAEVGQLDVLGQREQAPDAARSAWRGGDLVRRVALDDGHLDARIDKSREVRDGRTDGATSDYRKISPHVTTVKRTGGPACTSAAPD